LNNSLDKQKLKASPPKATQQIKEKLSTTLDADAEQQIEQQEKAAAALTSSLKAKAAATSTTATTSSPTAAATSSPSLTMSSNVASDVQSLLLFKNSTHDLDKHCGVISCVNGTTIVCKKALNCTTHSQTARVQKGGRNKDFDALVDEAEAAEPKATEAKAAEAVTYNRKFLKRQSEEAWLVSEAKAAKVKQVETKACEKALNCMTHSKTEKIQVGFPNVLVTSEMSLDVLSEKATATEATATEATATEATATEAAATEATATEAAAAEATATEAAGTEAAGTEAAATEAAATEAAATEAAATEATATEAKARHPPVHRIHQPQLPQLLPKINNSER
jgi:hypothetical protein